MAVINDNKFLRPPEEVAPSTFDKASLTGIANKDKWAAVRVVSEMVPTPKISSNDAFPSGTAVEFITPDGTEYKGKIASKSGSDYLVEISQGESYIVPTGKLSKVTPESEHIKEAMRRYVAPSIEIIGKPTIEVQNRCCVRIACKDRRPSDDNLIIWASNHYPDWRLVDAIDGNNREIGLIFEILAAEDAKPQGGDQVSRGRPLSSELVEGTGVTAEEEVPQSLSDDLNLRDRVEQGETPGTNVAAEDQIPGGLADDKDPDDFCPVALEEGMKVEEEHTDDPDIAREIAMDHLTEDPRYYKKLRSIEASNIISFDDISEDVISLASVVPAKTAQIGTQIYRVITDKPVGMTIGFVPEGFHYDTFTLVDDLGGNNVRFDGQGVTVSPTYKDGDDPNMLIWRTPEEFQAWSTKMGHDQTAQLGEPGDGEDYKDLVRAARWVLARFNDSNPDFYAIPQESEEAGDGDSRIVRLSFLLEEKTEDNQLSHLYISKGGKIVQEAVKEPGMEPVRGYVQVDAEGNLPMLMINTPMGPENVQEYGFDFSAEREIEKLADYDACVAAADDVLGEFDGYSAAAQAAFEARLVKLGVDDSAKDYWRGFFGQYGKMMTRDISKKKKKAHKKTAIDDHAKQYWINYFGAGGSAWYGEAMTRDIPRRSIEDTSTQKKEATTDYEGYIKEEGGKYKVKSKNNPDWSGGIYDTKGDAEKRLQQVEMFKHMSKKACETDGIVADSTFVNRMTIVGVILDDIIHKSAGGDIEALFSKPQFSRRKQPTTSGTPLRDIYDIATWSLEIAGKDEKMYSAVYSLVYDFLRKNPTFLQNQLGTDNLDQHGVGYTLTYALATSPRTFSKFKKSVNKYQRRWEKGKWQDLQTGTDSWRKEQKDKPKGKPKSKPKDKKEIVDVANQMGEELEVELEEDIELEVELEEDVEIELESSDLEEVKEAPQATQPAGVKQKSVSTDDWLNPEVSSTIPEDKQYKMEYISMKRKAIAAHGPITHNTSGKDDKKDYDHKDSRVQPSKSRTRFEIVRMYSTTSSADNGYIIMELAWEPESFKSMSDQNIQQQIISHIKCMGSNKEFHDFGIMGRIRIMDFDKDAGVARIKVRSSETRGVPTLGYAGDIDQPIPTSGIR